MLGLGKKTIEQHRARRLLRRTEAITLLKARYHAFRAVLASNARAVDAVTEIAMRLHAVGGEAELAPLARRLIVETREMVEKLNWLEPDRHRLLFATHRRIASAIEDRLATSLPAPVNPPLCVPLGSAAAAPAGQLGNKASVLARLTARPEFRVPDGFVVTLPGCRLFLEHQGLSLGLARLMTRLTETWSADDSRELQELIRNAPLPPPLATALLDAARPFFKNNRGLAVRSSSASEDGQLHSFAGQFTSVLNITNEQQLLAAFREVVASSFSARSLAYRRHAGLDPLAFDMAVLCLEMVAARVAGILLTRLPQDPDSGVILVSAVPGLGEAAVSGSAAADLYYLGRDGTVDHTRSVIVAKEQRLACQKGGGVVWEPVPRALQEQTLLQTAELGTLARWAVDLEEWAKTPQDVEWAMDQAGDFFLLQARPLTTLQGQPPPRSSSGPPPLASGIGAAGGRATGRVRLVRNRQDLVAEPTEPTVLVMPQSFVDAANILPLVAGVLVDLGNPADHLACVAREHAVPLISGLGDASRSLADAGWVTVDGSHGQVHAATEEEIAAAVAAWQPAAARQTVAQAMPPLQQELRELITALNLTDAYGPTFNILECHSLHDIVRYVHEKAVLAMFNAGDVTLEENLGAVHILDAPVPFFVSIIDVGGGLALEGRTMRRISPDRVVSRPFCALWQGIVTPGLAWGPPPGGSPMGSVVSSWLTDHKSSRPIGMPNYAMVSRDYCNLNARMDFHFTMVDAVCAVEPRNNHIQFRFKGGGANLVRRQRRAICIGTILEHYGFLADVRDDLVNATLQGAPAAVIEEKLVVVGRLLGFTRLLDAAMGDDGMVRQVADAFIQGDYGLTNLVAAQGDVAPNG